MSEKKTGLASRVLEGEVLAAAKLISGIEDEVPSAFEEMGSLYTHTGRAYIIGITGTPGAGKSTLVDCLIGYFRQKGKTVGVVAVDPSSAFTGGAILGDRIRMQRHSLDKDVFIRSLATRGWVGGLAKATIGAVHIMDALGKDVIFIETVGSGQIEIDITKAADTTVMVLTPGAGDEIQMMKAGILEAADVFAINKADKEGADSIKVELELSLSMRTHHTSDWKPNVLMTQAIYGKGIDELGKEIEKHRDFLVTHGKLEERQRARAKLELMETMQSYLDDFVHKIDQGNYLERIIDDLLKGKTNPHQATLEITARLATDLCQLRDSGS